MSYAVVHANWKLVANRDRSHVELYDFENDVYETKDLKESKPEVTKELLEKIENWIMTLPEKPTSNVFSKERQTMKANK